MARLGRPCRRWPHDPHSWYWGAREETELPVLSALPGRCARCRPLSAEADLRGAAAEAGWWLRGSPIFRTASFLSAGCQRSRNFEVGACRPVPARRCADCSPPWLESDIPITNARGFFRPWHCEYVLGRSAACSPRTPWATWHCMRSIVGQHRDTEMVDHAAADCGAARIGG